MTACGARAGSSPTLLSWFVPKWMSVTTGAGVLGDKHIEQNRNLILPMLLFGMDSRGDVDYPPEAVC